jgi:hypothetical protein
MQITTTTNHAIAFTIEAFWDEEGGMGRSQFGDSTQTLEEAVHLLEVARTQKKTLLPDGAEWVIVGNVYSTTTK